VKIEEVLKESTAKRERTNHSFFEVTLHGVQIGKSPQPTQMIKWNISKKRLFYGRVLSSKNSWKANT